MHPSLKFMKPNPILISIALILLAGVAAYFLFGKGILFPPETPAPQVEPEFIEGAFLEDPDEKGAFLETAEPIEVSLQRAKEGKTVAVSWDEEIIQVFHVVLLDNEFNVLWLISALNGREVTEISQRETSFFVPAGYVLGDRIEGLESFQEPVEFELTPGQEYYLQMIGFTKDGQDITVNKTFTFTASCFPPNCQ